MNKTIITILILCASIISKTVFIPIEKEVGEGMHAFLERAVNDAKKENPDKIVFEINTFGGRLDAAYNIVELLSSIEIKTVAYIKEKAISAGALIALSCNDIVMKENTTLGDCAPIIMSQQGPKLMGEKYQSVLRAKFRSLAKKNNYPEKLSEAMVSMDKEVIEIEIKGEKRILTKVEYDDLTEEERKNITDKKTLVPKGELLTMGAHEAREYGFSRKTVKNEQELYEFLDINKDEIISITKKKSEELFIIMNKIAPILILIGLAGLYMELKTPGFGVFGIIGITAFAIFFSTKYIVGLADYIEFVIFFAGIVLIAVELFVIPGFGITGAAGIGLILVSILLAMQSFVIPKMPWDVVLFKKNLLIVGIIFITSLPLFFISFFSASKIVLKTGISHKESEHKKEGYGPSEDYLYLVGKKGIVLSDLRPAGTAEIDNKRYDVVSDGEYIKSGNNIIVEKTIGNRIVVTKEYT